MLCTYNAVENSRSFKNVSLLPGFIHSFLALICYMQMGLQPCFVLCVIKTKATTLLRHASPPSVTHPKLFSFLILE